MLTDWNRGSLPFGVDFDIITQNASDERTFIPSLSLQSVPVQLSRFPPFLPILFPEGKL